MFKKGYLVKCLEDYSDHFTKDKIYEVREITSHGSLGIVEDDRGSRTNGWAMEYFIKVANNNEVCTSFMSILKCECGKEKHGFANHTTWCDIKE